MSFALKVAWRYLWSTRLQTGLLVAGGALGVVVFIVLASLAKGLAATLTDAVAGSIPHVTIEPAPVRARAPASPSEGTVVQAVTPLASTFRPQVRNVEALLALSRSQPGVKGATARVIGSAFILRGESRAAVTINGTEAADLDLIAPIGAKLVAGEPDLARGGLIIGETLAKDLELKVGSVVLLRSDRGNERLIRIDGIYKAGDEGEDRGSAYLALAVARALFDLPGGVDQIGLKLNDADEAPALARRLRESLTLRVTAWQERNPLLAAIIVSQTTQANIIQAFTLMTVLVGVASALLLSTYRRRSEIGIMRSFGLSRGFVASVFVLQGLILGALSSLAGVAAGWGFTFWLGSIRTASGDILLPIRQDAGAYLVVLAATVSGSALAALLPARAASRVDPLEVVGE